jgi:hypothetical protein
MSTNHVSGSLSSEDVQAILDQIIKLQQQMAFLINLSPDEKHSMPKFGEKSRTFVATAVTVATQNPDMLTRGFNMEALKNNASLLEALYPIRLALDHLTGMVDDTYFAAGCDAYNSARQVYSLAKSAHLNTGGFEGALQDLSRRFARHARATDKASNGQTQPA